jgi:hypothetical protein
MVSDVKTTFRRFGAAAVSAVAVVAVGITGAATASAATSRAYPLCVDEAETFQGRPVEQPVCAYARNSDAMTMQNVGGSVTNWYYGKGYGEIKQANTDLCMQLDNSGGNIVIEAKCSSAKPPYQEWAPNGSDQIRSKWGKTALCLTYDKDQGILKVGGCSLTNAWYQKFILQFS